MAKRIFRVELQWQDTVSDKALTFSIHQDFPDASRASAFATAFVPEGEPLPPRFDCHEIARTENVVVRLFEVGT